MPALQAIKNVRCWIFDEMDRTVKSYGGHRMTRDWIQGSFQEKN